MDLRSAIHSLGPDLPVSSLSELTAAWTPRLVKKGQMLARQGERTTNEFMFLDGKIVSLIADSAGRCVCVGLCIGPGLVAPHISRTREGISLVTLEVKSDSTIAEINSDALLAMMLRSSEIRDWANGILRRELSKKTDREWCLAALGGAERVAWFRDRYPEHEAKFAHALIASFIGMTPVTFSRLRKSA